MKIQYQEIKFRHKSLDLIQKSNDIIDAYVAKGFKLTLRQLYYQLVSKNFIENTEQSYKSIGELIKKARLAGLIDWNVIEDRTRSLKRLSHWSSPIDMLNTAVASYNVDIRQDQRYYVEVWVEKEALAGIVQKAADANDVPYLSCRGYLSQSEMWNAATSRLIARKEKTNQTPVIIYLGDHDPSGIDMPRDIVERLSTFNVSSDLIFDKIALTMNQIEAYKPPPNPAKITDSRAKEYIRKYGSSSWELDSLNPEILTTLIDKRCKRYISDMNAYNQRRQQIIEEKKMLQTAKDNWNAILKQFHKND